MQARKGGDMQQAMEEAAKKRAEIKKAREEGKKPPKEALK